MLFPIWFTKLMESEPVKTKKKSGWIIDESKCLSLNEVEMLRTYSKQAKAIGLGEKKFSQIRDWFMIELGLNSGLRVGEMAALKHGNLLIDDLRSSIVIFGKGNKKRAVWINSDFKKICQDFLSIKKKLGFTTDDYSYVLNNLKDQQIVKRSLQKFFKVVLERAGLPNYYYVHCLRHTYATFLLKASNYNYRFVQQQLGHSSIRTTQVYANVLESDGREAIEKLYK